MTDKSSPPKRRCAAARTDHGDLADAAGDRSLAAAEGCAPAAARAPTPGPSRWSPKPRTARGSRRPTTPGWRRARGRACGSPTRARCARGSRSRPRDPAGDLAFLERLALWAQRWGPWAALDPPDGLLVDVSAVAHLFGGEARLLADAQARLAARGPRRAAGDRADRRRRLGARALRARTRRDPRSGRGCRSAARRPARGGAAARCPRCCWCCGGSGSSGSATSPGSAATRSSAASAAASPAANPLLRLDQLLGRVPEPLLPVVARPAGAGPAAPARADPPPRAARPGRGRPRRRHGARARRRAARARGGSSSACGGSTATWRSAASNSPRRRAMPAHIARLFAAQARRRRRRLRHRAGAPARRLGRAARAWRRPISRPRPEDHGTSLAACIDRLTVRLGPGRGAPPGAPRQPHPRARAALAGAARARAGLAGGSSRSTPGRSSCSTGPSRSRCSTPRPTASRAASAGAAACTRSSASKAPNGSPPNGGARRAARGCATTTGSRTSAGPPLLDLPRGPRRRRPRRAARLVPAGAVRMTGPAAGPAARRGRAPHARSPAHARQAPDRRRSRT